MDGGLGNAEHLGGCTNGRLVLEDVFAETDGTLLEVTGAVVGRVAVLVMAMDWFSQYGSLLGARYGVWNVPAYCTICETMGKHTPSRHLPHEKWLWLDAQSNFSGGTPLFAAVCIAHE